MDHSTGTTLRIGAWDVNPVTGQISRESQIERVEARTLRLLLCLADRAGETVSIDDLLTHVWAGVVVSPDSVYQAVASLRRLLGDDPKQPTYIVTVPRLGYRMVATVTRPSATPSGENANPASSESGPAVAISGFSPGTESANRRSMLFRGGMLGLVVAGAVLLGWMITSRQDDVSITAPATTTIAVLPFLDLSEEMNQEYLADGMTEALVARLSKVAGLRVPAPRDSFHLKDREVTIAQAARTLNVTHVVDGSVRKSGAAIEVNTQLVRSETGFILWSQTYRGSVDDLLRIQDEITAEVVKALGLRTRDASLTEP